MKSERELWLEKRVEEQERERAILPAVVEQAAVLEAEVAELRAAILDPGGWDERCKKAEAALAVERKAHIATAEQLLDEREKSERQSQALAEIVVLEGSPATEVLWLARAALAAEVK